MSGGPQQSLTYRDAGVDIDRGARLVDRIRNLARSTMRPEVRAGVGGFGALFEIPVDRYRHPVLVSGTDGVGTKLRVAIDAGVHDTIGVDLVAMCANDVLVHGAEPLFFLDYYASGRLDLEVAEAVVAGIARGCVEAGAALVGGESAEMPGLYAAGDYDLAGFCVGVVEREAAIDGRRVVPGDVLVGLASSGLHANGYSLVRRILADRGTTLDEQVEGRGLADILLTPTRIYVRPVLDLVGTGVVKAIAHVTGGGLVDNLPRVLPEGTGAVIRTDAWTPPPIFEWLARAGNVDEAEMYRTFNCGIGMVVCVAAEDAADTLSRLAAHGEDVRVIGTVEPSPGRPPTVRLE